MTLLSWILQNIPALIGYVTVILHAVIAIFVLIPGAEPEATLQKIVDWIESISRK